MAAPDFESAGMLAGNVRRINRRGHQSHGRAGSSSSKKVDEFFARESRFPQQGHQSSFWQVAVVTGNYRSAARGGMGVDEWLPEVWSRAKPFCSRKRMTCRGLIAGSFAIYFTYINYKAYKTSSNSRICEEVENRDNEPRNQRVPASLYSGGCDFLRRGDKPGRGWLSASIPNPKRRPACYRRLEWDLYVCAGSRCSR